MYQLKQVVLRLSAWLGGTIFSSLPSFEKICMTLEDYNEKGAGWIQEICL